VTSPGGERSKDVSDIEEDSPKPLEPEAVVSGLRALRDRIAEVTPFGAAERKVLRDSARMSDPILQASINVIGAFEQVSRAVTMPADALRRLYEEANRWTAVEDELWTMFQGVAGANLVRRRQIALIAAQAYKIGAELARDPANAELLPQIEEIKRLRKLARRKKTAGASPSEPETPES
jgi:hypothetical protein